MGRYVIAIHVNEEASEERLGRGINSHFSTATDSLLKMEDGETFMGTLSWAMLEQ